MWELILAGVVSAALAVYLVYALLRPEREFGLLAPLVKHAGKVVTHRQLLTAVWGPAHAEDTQYLRVYVGQLRDKLANSDAASMIETEAGIGYRLRSDRA